MKMKINKISSKFIKPHTPTPPNLKTHKISFLDQLAMPIKTGVILFYASKPNDERQLEESLARALVQFYPLAGRYRKDDLAVDCCDEGVEFIKAEAADDVDLKLTDVAAKNDLEQHKDLLPDQYFRHDEGDDDPLLSIQATYFSSGGVSIAISVAHRVFDLASLGQFVAAWSSGGGGTSPSFELSSLVPSSKDHKSPIDASKLKALENEKFVAKRFVFGEEALKPKTSRVRNGKAVPRVRVVCAIIAKVLMGIDRAKHGKQRNVLIVQPINMREKTNPPLPKHACGNLSVTTATRCITASEAQQMGTEELGDIMGDAVRKLIVDSAQQVLSPDMINNLLHTCMKSAMKPDMFVIHFSDWSKFGFQQVDLGWGPPVGTSIGPKVTFNNTSVLMSNKEGGVEAWVHLTQNDMRLFEEDDLIKIFTS